jgi:hypothetical protein
MSKSTSAPGTGLDPHQKAFIKAIDENARRYRRHEVFRDFCELAALSFSNAVDPRQFDAREARYLEIVRRYEPDEVKRFPIMLGHIVESLSCGFHDSLGQIFMAMELGDHWKGQFFTPYSVAYLMAQMTLTDVRSVIEEKGFFTLNEPTAGGGAMVIAAANALHDEGLNYQQVMHVTAQDIDETAVHMTYVQLCLLHIPAVVIHGNSLWPDKTWAHWVTPAHVLGMWDVKLRRRERAEAAEAPETIEKTTCAEAPAIEQRRDEIIERRIAQTEQLTLFA